MERLFPGFGEDAPPEASADPSAVAVPSAGGPSETRFALLIGNSAYRTSPLRNPVRDTRLVGEALRQLGFSVTRVENGTLAEMRGAVAEFALALEPSDPDSVALFYFAGHGVQGGGINYLIPADADIPEPRYLTARALPLDEVVAKLSGRPRHANILVLDACRSTALAKAGNDQTGFSGGLAALDLPPAGMLVAYSTAAGRGADDGKGQNSPYATALVESLPALLEPGRRVHDIFVETADKVRAATGGAQNPALFLQGGLPALTLAPQDQRRRSRYNPWGPARARRVALLTIAATLVALALGFAALVWAYMAPVDKRLVLSFVGLADPPGVGLSCIGPLDGVLRDSYGLTAAEWCQLLPDDLVVAADRTANLGDRLDTGFASGDPKALFLRAQGEISRAPKLPGAIFNDVEYDLIRAAQSGLPVAALALNRLAQSDHEPPWTDALQSAADAGHLPSAAELAVLKVASGTDAGIAAGLAELQALRLRDPSGFAAQLLSDVYWGIVTPKVEQDIAVSAAFALEAARKGNVRAIDALFSMQDDGHVEISKADTDQFMTRLFDLGQEDGYWWKYNKLYMADTEADDLAALALLRQMMVRFPRGDAAFRFADLVARGIGGPVSHDEVAQALDQAVVAQSPNARQLRGGFRMGLYEDADHQSLVPIDAAGALSDLKAAQGASDTPGAAMDLAQYDLRGVGGMPDMDAAVALLQRAMTSENPAMRTDAQSLLSAIAIAKALKPDVSSADLLLGPPDAPVTLTVYADPDCADCDLANLAGTLDGLQATYIRLGLVQVQIRPVAPVDGSLTTLGRISCLIQNAPPGTVAGLVLSGPGAAPPPCVGAVPDASLGPANRSRWDMLRSKVLKPGAPLAPQGLPWSGPSTSMPVQTPALPVLIANGWVLSSNTGPAVEETIFRLLSPERQAMVRLAGRQSCAARAQAPAGDAADARPPEGFQSLFCPGP